jgi:hypothetical protein
MGLAQDAPGDWHGGRTEVEGAPPFESARRYDYERLKA